MMANVTGIRKKIIWLTGILVILVAAMAWLFFSDHSEPPEPKASVQAEQAKENSNPVSPENAGGKDTDSIRPTRPTLKTLTPRLEGLQMEEKNKAINTGEPSDGSRAARDRFYQAESGDTLWELAGRMDSYDDSFRWPLLYLQNRQAIDHLIYDSSTGKWLARVLPSTTLKLEPDPQPVVQPEKGFSGKAFAVQLLSLSEKNRKTAYAVTKNLIESGYCAYLYRTRHRIYAPSRGKAIHFYRIRVGPFKSAAEAKNTGKEILLKMSGTGLFPRKYWVTGLSEREISGRQIDFGVQRRAPWVFQVSQNQHLRQALKTFHMVEERSDFAYIRAVSVIPYGKLYSVRVGFFPSQDAALKRFNTLQQQTGYQLEQYLPIELYDPFELIPAGF